MAAPTTTIWTLEPHTRAKHAILRRYLQAWMAILPQGGFKKIAYIDGFAGPGMYMGGEDGSPVIALKAAADHASRVTGEIVFLFVERKPDRADFLRELVSQQSIPGNFVVEVDGGRTFEQAFQDFRDDHTDLNGRLPPTFAFIDPFGWKGVPFSLVQFILGQRSCEVLITFMYEEMNRFIGHPDQAENFDSFFGTPEWREGMNLVKPAERNRFLHDLYLRQLKNVAHAKYVRSFQMQNASGLTDYYLFYATGNALGLKKMKEAMWSADPSGEFAFSDATDQNQFVLFGSEPRYDVLQNQLLKRFKGSEVSVGDVEDFVISETAFRETHYKRILKELEMSSPARIVVTNAPAKRKRGTFASPSLRLRFL